MRSRLTYANVTATLALFLALGGSSYAVVQYTGKNIRDGSLTTKDVKNRTLLAKDFRKGQLKAGPQGAKGDQGAQGIQGVQGEKGDDGAPGAPGSAAAYAKVDASGNLYGPPLTKNIDRATQINFGSPVVGYYCLHATVPVNNIVATLGSTDSPGGEIKAEFVTNIHCTSGGSSAPVYNVQVSTFNSAGAFENRSFYIAIN
jgi:hypothetical protein